MVSVLPGTVVALLLVCKRQTSIQPRHYGLVWGREKEGTDRARSVLGDRAPLPTTSEALEALKVLRPGAAAAVVSADFPTTHVCSHPVRLSPVLLSISDLIATLAKN